MSSLGLSCFLGCVSEFPVSSPDAASDAASSDAAEDAGVDSGVDAGLPCENCDLCTERFQDALFCDSFEDGDLSAWEATEEVGTGTVRLVNADEAYRGSGALRFEVATIDDQALVMAKIPPQRDFVYVRAYVRYAPGTPSTSGMRLIEVRSEINPATFAVLHAMDGGEMFAAITTPTGARITERFSEPLLGSGWQCLQFTLRIGTNGAMRFALDGVLSSDLAGNTAPEAGPSYDEVSIGLLRSPPAMEGAILSVDDLVIDSKPIACD